MAERLRFNSEYVQSFAFGVKLLSRLCLLAVPFVLYFVTISLGANLLQSLPLLSKPGLSIISAQSFPYDSNDPLGIRKTEKRPIYMLKVNTEMAITPEQARQELARRELARRGESADFPASQASRTSSGVSFDLYVKTNRATTGTTEYSRLREQAERILNDDRVIHFYPDDKNRAPDPESRFDIKTARLAPFRLDEIPDYMKTVIPSETTSLGRVVNVVGFIGVSIFCLALYFPLTKSIVDLFRRRRTIKK